jgi:hypothetical protein
MRHHAGHVRILFRSPSGRGGFSAVPPLLPHRGENAVFRSAALSFFPSSDRIVPSARPGRGAAVVAGGARRDSPCQPEEALRAR